MAIVLKKVCDNDGTKYEHSDDVETYNLFGQDIELCSVCHDQLLSPIKVIIEAHGRKPGKKAPTTVAHKPVPGKGVFGCKLCGPDFTPVQTFRGLGKHAQSMHGLKAKDVISNWGK